MKQIYEIIFNKLGFIFLEIVYNKKEVKIQDKIKK